VTEGDAGATSAMIPVTVRGDTRAEPRTRAYVEKRTK
jgi:hypothetical protein